VPGPATLVFEATPLAEVVWEFNRYNHAQIKVTGQAAILQDDGVFNADEPQALLTFLRKNPALDVRATDTELRSSLRLAERGTGQLSPRLHRFQPGLAKSVNFKYHQIPIVNLVTRANTLGEVSQKWTIVDWVTLAALRTITKMTLTAGVTRR